MRTTKPTMGARPGWSRVAGYGGAVLLVVAAVVVLLMPLFDGNDGARAGDRNVGATGRPSDPAPPGAGGPSAAPTNPTPQQNQGGRPYPTTQPRQRGGQGGQGQQGGLSPTTGDVGFTWCPQGTAFYRPTGDSRGVEVVVRVSGNGAVKAEVITPGGSKTQQTTVRGGRPHTFRFPGVAPLQVQRVKITTLSTGLSSDTCYAPPGS
ncbi:hypothetical protein [Actinomadura kijaniata]|uniref:hypothetical protein n=1 Tax=Actinomadura kijaniata TaxID=46161 RepID=UPI00082A1BDD|nr:hypothetical protein [Actinomadura kijaniata]